MSRDRAAGSAGGAPVSPLDYLATETAGGLLLVAAATAGLIWANSPWQDAYRTLWHSGLGVHLGRWELELDLRHWVNDGLMAVFFLVVGLEVKRELVLGELRDRRRAALPVFGALGGMLVPAAIFALVDRGGAGGHGWGVPMATDIAFALGVLALLAPRAPSGARVFLLTLAIVDDIGAILVIAVFYSSGIRPGWLLAAVAIVAAVVVLRRVEPAATPVFVVLGLALWLTVHASGVHATLAGVVMGLLVPASPMLSREIVRTRTDDLLDVFTPQAARETTRIARQAVSQLEWLEHELHGFSSAVIVPIFAFANAGVTFTHDSLRSAATSRVTIGVVVALVVGKFGGILAGAWVGLRTGHAERPPDVGWVDLAGVAALGGIGFTVSLFITGLAFSDPRIVDEAKIGVFVASVVAGAAGAMILRRRR